MNSNNTKSFSPVETRRIERLIRKAINFTTLDLRGLNVLTEVGSANFLFTPIIAKMAGAQTVFAWTKDSVFGRADEVIHCCKNFLNSILPGDNDIIFRANQRPNEDAAAAQIITNLGMIRPIGAELINAMAPDAVVPYMCEAWERREADVDIAGCTAKGIKVAGTWENHPHLKIFEGCGPLSVKLAQSAGFEVYQNRIAVISTDHFGEVACHAFKGLGGNPEMIAPQDCSSQNFDDYDFIFLADYKFDGIYIGENGILNHVKVPIVHLIGNVSCEYAVKAAMQVYPFKNGFNMRMTNTLADLGVKPVIDLHTAGLKVGEAMYRGIDCVYAQPINY